MSRNTGLVVLRKEWKGQPCCCQPLPCYSSSSFPFFFPIFISDVYIFFTFYLISFRVSGIIFDFESLHVCMSGKGMGWMKMQGVNWSLEKTLVICLHIFRSSPSFYFLLLGHGFYKPSHLQRSLLHTYVQLHSCLLHFASLHLIGMVWSGRHWKGKDGNHSALFISRLMHCWVMESHGESGCWRRRRRTRWLA
jgi:hypothetical protein